MSLKEARGSSCKEKLADLLKAPEWKALSRCVSAFTSLMFLSGLINSTVSTVLSSGKESRQMWELLSVK